ncbi:hypothetical protein MVEG_11101 [Podila verticillata NRRL 6337]|uniref:ABC transporter domain-containing protein n=1 Tax=Podila verticillata NRRL 6337 TaxID=1069443 RepID=A0A086TM87_9FUNG|nr:hypothetical protein MVEG_11101 [Podila verticillata NRRL 6337]
MAAGERFVAENAAKTDASTTAYFTYITSNRRLQIRLEALGAVIVLGAALFAVLSRETLSPSMVGLALSYSLTVTEDVTWMDRSFCDLQNSLVSVERIHEYVQKNPEAPSAMVADVTLPEKRPSEGRVEFRNYSTRYCQGLDLVIKSISFEVQPAERVGIVGRTGAGKSSLTLALFRNVEAANSHWARASHNGEDMDVDPIKARQQQQGRHGGSREGGCGRGWRLDLDRWDRYFDGRIESSAHAPGDHSSGSNTLCGNCEREPGSIRRAPGRRFVGGTGKGAFEGSYRIADRGAGVYGLAERRQLFGSDCRVGCGDGRVDPKTIRKEFKDRTILTIAHRIKTVMDSDKILVLEKGHVQEFESPNGLLQRRDSLFFKLAQQAGEIKED